MNRRRRIAALLLFAYPAAWRREYGKELLSILVARPLSMHVAIDIISNGLWQRTRATHPSTLLGLPPLAAIVISARTQVAIVRPTAMTFPTMEVIVMSSDWYAVLAFACGCWTALGVRTPAQSPAWAAARMSLAASLPVTLGAILVAANLTDGSLAATITAGASPWMVMVAPLVRLPLWALWGSAGGSLGRWILRRLRPAATA